MAENEEAGSSEPRQDSPPTHEPRSEQSEHPETLRLRAQALGATGFAGR